MEGHLYSIRHGAYSVVVATSTPTQAREIFARWLSTRGFANLRPESISPPKRTRAQGNRYLLIDDGKGNQ